MGGHYLRKNGKYYSLHYYLLQESKIKALVTGRLML